MTLFESAGIDISYIIIGILCVLLALVILYIVLLNKFKAYKKNYDLFMKGSDGKSLEASLVSKYREIDMIRSQSELNAAEIQTLFDNLKFAYQKFSIHKYDAFKEMGGKLSFSLCMLTDNDDGFVMTSMHSTNEGCFTYIKEIIKGESYVLLSEEEKKVLTEAKSRKSCLDD